mmetsp:Transcript_11774/g.47540  ORF Transcript_11774/g.47540 Transcript_11774/m.47540 type:complete len:265 (+) Transcript_11774:943-1737(+)
MWLDHHPNTVDYADLVSNTDAYVEPHIDGYNIEHPNTNAISDTIGDTFGELDRNSNAVADSHGHTVRVGNQHSFADTVAQIHWHTFDDTFKHRLADAVPDGHEHADLHANQDLLVDGNADAVQNILRYTDKDGSVNLDCHFLTVWLGDPVQFAVKLWHTVEEPHAAADIDEDCHHLHDGFHFANEVDQHDYQRHAVRHGYELAHRNTKCIQVCLCVGHFVAVRYHHPHGLRLRDDNWYAFSLGVCHDNVITDNVTFEYHNVDHL